MAVETFADPTQFTIAVTAASPPATGIVWIQEPQGVQSVPQGGTLTLNSISGTALGLQLQNTGGGAGVFTVTAAISGPVSGPWYLFEVQSSSGGTETLTTPTATPGPITLAPGEWVILWWGISFEDAQVSYAGTYTTTATVSVGGSGQTYTDPTTFELSVI